MKNQYSYGLVCNTLTKQKITKLLQGKENTVTLKAHSIMSHCLKNFNPQLNFFFPAGFSELLRTISVAVERKEFAVFKDAQVVKTVFQRNLNAKGKAREIVSLSGTFLFQYQKVLSGLAINSITNHEIHVEFNFNFERNKKEGYLFLHPKE